MLDQAKAAWRSRASLADVRALHPSWQVLSPNVVKALTSLLMTFSNAAAWQVACHDHSLTRTALRRPRVSAGVSMQPCLEYESVVKTLQADVPRILRRELNWEVFAQDFKVIDRRGAKVEGVGPNRLLLKCLRATCRKNFILNDNIEIYSKTGPFLLVRWKVDLINRKSPFVTPATILSYLPVPIVAETSFHLNEENQIDYVRVDKWLVNGEQFQRLPEVRLADDDKSSRDKIKKWAKDITWQPSRVPAGDASPSRAVESSEARATDMNAVQGLQAILPDILVREPSWEYFAKDFKMIDQQGVVEGLGNCKALLQMLQELHHKLSTSPFKDDFQIQLEMVNETSSDGVVLAPLLVANWKYDIYHLDLNGATLEELKKAYLPLLPKSSSFPQRVAGRSSFQFNPDGKVNAMKMDSLSINGSELKFPNGKLPDSPYKAVLSIWAKEVFCGASQTSPQAVELPTLNSETVEETLRADIPKLLRKEPRWHIFSEDFKLVDRTPKIQGLKANKKFLKLLRLMKKNYVMPMNDIKIVAKAGPFLLVRWKVNLVPNENPAFVNPLSLLDYIPVDIEADSRSWRPSANSSLQDDRRKRISDPSTSTKVEAIEGLQAALPYVLVLEPDWSWFAQDFKLIDQAGVTVEGLQASKVLLTMLQNLHDKFIAMPFMKRIIDDFQVQAETAFETSTDGTLQPILVTRWKYNFHAPLDLDPQAIEDLKKEFLPYLSMNYQVPLKIAAKSTFRFNQDGKISSMKIDSWSTDGNEVKFPLGDFPESSSTDEVARWIKELFFQFQEEDRSF